MNHAGITVEHNTAIEYCGPETGDVWAVRDTAFVGGVADGLYGAGGCSAGTWCTWRLAGVWFAAEGFVVQLQPLLACLADASFMAHV